MRSSVAWCAGIGVAACVAASAVAPAEAPCVQRLLELADRSDATDSIVDPGWLDATLRAALHPLGVEELDDPAAWRCDWWSGLAIGARGAVPVDRGMAAVEPYEADGIRGMAVPPNCGGVVRDVEVDAQATVILRARVKLGDAKGEVLLQAQPLAEWHAPGDPRGPSRKKRLNAAQRNATMETRLTGGDGWSELELVIGPQIGRAGVRIVVASAADLFALDRVEVLVAPGWASLFGSTAVAALPTVRADGRCALTVGRVRAEGVLLPAGAKLAIDAVVPARAPRCEALFAPISVAGAAAPEIELKIDGESVATRELAAAAGSAGAESPLEFVEWRCDLARFAGRAVRLEFVARGGGACFVGAPLLLGATASPPPTLVLLSIDTLRADQLHGFGHPDARTPAIDRLAAEGTCFTGLHTASSWTLPAHASIMTALPAAAHGATRTERGIPSRARVLAEQLAAAGFATAAVTGGGMVDPQFGFAQGFDRYSMRDPALGPFVDDAGEASWPVEPALEWLERHRDVPTFLFVHTYCVHNYKPEPEFAARVPALDGFDLATQSQLLARATAGDATTRPLLVALYDAALRQVDERLVAPLLAQLDREGRAARSVVTLLSDHGDEWFDHERAFHGEELWSELTRVPWIARGPGFAAGAVDARPVGHVDVAPTLLARLGLPRLELCAGRDLLADPESVEPILESVWSAKRGAIDALIAGPWKLVRRKPSEDAAAVDRLFRIDDDPAERHDLSEQEPARHAQLIRLLDAKLAECRLLQAAVGGGTDGGGTDGGGTDGEVAIDPALEAELRALGYLGDEK